MILTSSVRNDVHFH